jgi:hypothetical protein
MDNASMRPIVTGQRYMPEQACQTKACTITIRHADEAAHRAGVVAAGDHR